MKPRKVCYGIPFPKGTKWEKRNPKGAFAHQNFSEAMYAVDLLAPEGTSVLAAREGTVWNVKSDSSVSIQPEKVAHNVEKAKSLAARYTNWVCIEHCDGTYAEYLHVADNVPVRRWQSVEKGEVIGYVGMSGITSQPHLHFNVFVIKETQTGKQGYSIPFEWER